MMKTLIVCLTGNASRKVSYDLRVHNFFTYGRQRDGRLRDAGGVLIRDAGGPGRAGALAVGCDMRAKCG